MEANEAQELQEHAEHGSHESVLRPVAFTMSVLAVLVAVTTVLAIARTPKRYWTRTRRRISGMNIRHTRSGRTTRIWRRIY